MMDEQPGEVLFRASKRRKVVRKPVHVESLDDALSPLQTGSDAAITKQSQEGDEHSSGGVTRIQKRGPGRKFGIAFSSADNGRSTGQEEVEEQALVAVSEDGMSEPPKIDRFVKPTGRVGVTEDKHMMAYVDSKLAEIRPSAGLATTSTRENGGIGSPGTEDISNTLETNLEATAEKTASAPSGPTIYQQAQERSRKVYQRPTKRRPPPAREQTAVNRDSMIDEIMGENQVPHYDRSAPQAQHEERDDIDNDTAAAEAFKAQLLADLQRNKRRPPKSSTTTSTGPKLGGSRAQREKMRALEEAKANTGKK